MLQFKKIFEKLNRNDLGWDVAIGKYDFLVELFNLFIFCLLVLLSPFSQNKNCNNGKIKNKHEHMYIGHEKRKPVGKW